MQTIRITKEFDFEMAHALHGHDGPCRYIHGHSYKLSVTVRGKPFYDISSPKNGMVMDFKELKAIVKTQIINRFDHALVLSNLSEITGLAPQSELLGKLIRVDFQPSSENLLIHFAGILRPLLPPGVELFSMRLCETATSCAEWYASDNL